MVNMVMAVLYNESAFHVESLSIILTNVDFEDYYER